LETLGLEAFNYKECAVRKKMPKQDEINERPMIRHHTVTEINEIP
jgi:hypothetical protein